MCKTVKLVISTLDLQCTRKYGLQPGPTSSSSGGPLPKPFTHKYFTFFSWNFYFFNSDPNNIGNNFKTYNNE